MGLAHITASDVRRGATPDERHGTDAPQQAIMITGPCFESEDDLRLGRGAVRAQIGARSLCALVVPAVIGALACTRARTDDPPAAAVSAETRTVPADAFTDVIPHAFRAPWIPRKMMAGGSCVDATFCIESPHPHGPAASECAAVMPVPESVATPGNAGRSASFSVLDTNNVRREEKIPSACCYTYRSGPRCAP